jgi:hypothetical protein
MLRHAWLGSPGFYSFIASNLTSRDLRYRKEMRSIRNFNIKFLFNA